MTSAIFTEWLKKLDKSMGDQGRQIVLLLDNAPCHIPNIVLKNVSILYLPPNTTAHLQPMDAGIIRNFKLKYRKSLLSHYVRQIDAVGKFQPISMKEALYLVKDLWDVVSQDTIRNCFQHTGILLKSAPVPSQQAGNDQSLQELQQMIARVTPDDPLDSQDYVLLPEEDACIEEMTDEDIVELLTGSNDDDGSDEEDNPDDRQGGPDSQPYTLHEALLVCQRLLLTLESHESFSEKHYGALRKIRRQVDVVKSQKSIQTSITDYFHVSN